MFVLNRFGLIKWQCYLTTSEVALKYFCRNKLTSYVKGWGRCKSQETQKSPVLPEEKMQDGVKFSKIRKVLSSHRVWKDPLFSEHWGNNILFSSLRISKIISAFCYSSDNVPLLFLEAKQVGMFPFLLPIPQC